MCIQKLAFQDRKTTCDNLAVAQAATALNNIFLSPPIQLRTLLKIFAFLLCFVLYVYVMIFQFEIKQSSLETESESPVGKRCITQLDIREAPKSPGDNWLGHDSRAWKQYCFSSRCFPFFSCRYKISYALNFVLCAILILFSVPQPFSEEKGAKATSTESIRFFRCDSISFAYAKSIHGNEN